MRELACQLLFSPSKWFNSQMGFSESFVMIRTFHVAFVLLLTIVASVAIGEQVRFIQIVKDETPDTRFHLSELEAFENGVVPDGLGGASFGGLATSTNDIGDGTLSTFGDGNLHPTVGTMTALEHGGGNKNPNNALESGGAVWSTANSQATNAQYTLDLGGTFDVTEVRLWPRADGCCTNRWRNLEVNLLADDGTGNPGDLIAQQLITAPGGNVPQSLQFEAAPVPEPASIAIWSILGLAGAGFGWYRIRRKK